MLVINGFIYLAYALVSGHVARDLWPRPRELRSVPRDIVNHLKLRFGRGEEARHYNVLQKISYAAVLFVILPVLVLAGIEMSPGLGSAAPWLRDAFGGAERALDPFHHGGAARAVCHRPRGHGRRLRAHQQSPLDDHRPLPHQGGDAPVSHHTTLGRRAFLAGAAGLALGGCDRVADTAGGRKAFAAANDASYLAQRAVMGAKSLAPEFTAADLSPDFRANGSIDPKDPTYRTLAKDKFASWSMPVEGLVEHPRGFTLADLKALPARTQITRHDCVEGWSCIGKWKGPTLASVLDLVVPKPEARYVVFHCYDQLGADQSEGNADPADEGNTLSGPPPKFYGSIDMDDATHPQTILAYEMNDETLSVAHGAPLRLRLERQLGYKMNKYIRSIELVESFAAIGGGKGGYWEDLGYDWYAGI